MPERDYGFVIKPTLQDVLEYVDAHRRATVSADSAYGSFVDYIKQTWIRKHRLVARNGWQEIPLNQPVKIVLEGLDLREIDLNNTDFSGVVFRECSFDEEKTRNMYLGRARFEECVKPQALEEKIEHSGSLYEIVRDSVRNSNIVGVLGVMIGLNEKEEQYISAMTEELIKELKKDSFFSTEDFQLYPDLRKDVQHFVNELLKDSRVSEIIQKLDASKQVFGEAIAEVIKVRIHELEEMVTSGRNKALNDTITQGIKHNFPTSRLLGGVRGFTEKEQEYVDAMGESIKGELKKDPFFSSIAFSYYPGLKDTMDKTIKEILANDEIKKAIRRKSKSGEKFGNIVGRVFASKVEELRKTIKKDRRFVDATSRAFHARRGVRQRDVQQSVSAYPVSATSAEEKRKLALKKRGMFWAGMLTMYGAGKIAEVVPGVGLWAKVATNVSGAVIGTQLAFAGMEEIDNLIKGALPSDFRDRTQNAGACVVQSNESRKGILKRLRGLPEEIIADGLVPGDGVIGDKLLEFGAIMERVELPLAAFAATQVTTRVFSGTGLWGTVVKTAVAPFKGLAALAVVSNAGEVMKEISNQRNVKRPFLDRKRPGSEKFDKKISKKLFMRKLGTAIVFGLSVAAFTVGAAFLAASTFGLGSPLLGLVAGLSVKTVSGISMALVGSPTMLAFWKMGTLRQKYKVFTRHGVDIKEEIIKSAAAKQEAERQAHQRLLSPQQEKEGAATRIQAAWRGRVGRKVSYSYIERKKALGRELGQLQQELFVKLKGNIQQVVPRPQYRRRRDVIAEEIATEYVKALKSSGAMTSKFVLEEKEQMIRRVVDKVKKGGEYDERIKQFLRGARRLSAEETREQFKEISREIGVSLARESIDKARAHLQERER